MLLWDRIGLRTFDFFEFVGALLPGSMLLIAIGFTFDADEARFLLAPTTVGGLGAHLLAAYVTGHFLQAAVIPAKAYTGRPGKECRQTGLSPGQTPTVFRERRAL